MNQEKPEEKLDVRILSRNDLPQDEFPGGKGEVFRVFFTPEVHAAVGKHASETTSVEICGVLVGLWQRDANGPFVRITESIRGEAAQSKFAEVTFTHETWAKINAQMDSTFLGLSIVGWYHTHPDFGVFLSDRDRFIQEHFFSGPGQVAYVVDPIRKAEGVFVWRDGKPTLTEHFWVGNRVVTAAAATADARNATMGTGARADAESKPQPQPASAYSGSWLPPPSRMLLYLCFFLIGYLLSGLRSRWEQAMIEEGVFSRLVMFKGLRLGLGTHLDLLQADLAEITRETEKLQADLAKGVAKSEDFSQTASVRPLRIALVDAATRVDQMKTRYGYTREEEAMLLGVAKARSRAVDNEKPPPAPSDEAHQSGPPEGSSKPTENSHTNELRKEK